MTGTVLRRYTFKLYPNRAQECALNGQRVMCAQLWNALLQMREDHRRRESQKPKDQRRTPTAFDQAKEITQLRKACPEWRVMSADSQALVAKMLDDAFKAFFIRAKKGAGASSGYPRYKSAKLWETIPFREMGKGWKITNGQCVAGAKAQSQTATMGKAGSRSSDPRNWRIYAKGIPGLIRTRGQLPREPLSWRNANIICRDGTWWLSACVEMKSARKAGTQAISIHLDLIDEFARVERMNGAVPAPRESANQTTEQGVIPSQGSDTFVSGSDGRLSKASPSTVSGSDTFTVEDLLGKAKALTERADAIKSSRDTRLRRRSYRWREETARAARLTLLAARIRKNALHQWTTAITREAAAIQVRAPASKEVTRSARGSASNHGAAVEINAALNRNTLNQAPAMAIQMLEYKSAEAAIPFALVKDEAPVTAVGRDISDVTKAVRKARRAIKMETAI